jgi:amidase
MPGIGHDAAMRRVHAFSDDALGDHDAVGLAQLLRGREVSARELVEAAAVRAARLQPLLNPVQYDDLEQARRDADRLDREGLGDGPLAGLPVFIKDNVDVARMPTLHGSIAFSGRPAGKDGPVAAHWRDLGVVMMGKSRLPEFGFSASTEYATEDPVRNPWDPAYSSGASSGGSAVLVAAGAVPVAHANDGGGSIRIPAAACGLVGLKPTRGRLPGEHVDRLLPVAIVSQGAVTRSVRDSAAFMAASELARPPSNLPRIGRVEGPASRRLRVGLLMDSVHETPTDAPTRAAVEALADLLAEHGHQVEEMPMPVEPHFADDFGLLWSLLAVLASRTGRLLLARDFDVDLTDPLTRGLADKAGKHLRQLPRALWRLRKVESQYREAFRTWDVVLSPTLGHVVPEIGHLSPNQDFDDLFAKLVDYVGFTPLANVAGAPSISLPVGLTGEGHLPIGAMLSAAHGDERTLLELAYDIEQAMPFPKITG